MSKSEMEQLLGAKLGRDEAKLWGTGEGEDPETMRLVSRPEDQRSDKFFRQVTRAISPPLMTGGGCVLEGDLIAPDGGRFMVLTFHGDVTGWQRQIEEGAALLRLVSGRIYGEMLLLSDGREIAIADCTIAE